MSRPRPIPLAGTEYGADRRATCRYTPTIKNVVLGWGRGGSHVEIPVELASISVQGCLVKSRVRPGPGPGQPIWFKAIGMRASDWVEGRIVSTRKPFFHRLEIRIQFVTTLPFYVFKVLVYGRMESDPEPVQRPEHETDQWWR